MEKEEKFLIFLLMQQTLTSAKVYSLLEKFGLPSKVFEMLKIGDEKLKTVLASEEIDKICQIADEVVVSKMIKSLQDKGINFVSIYSKNLKAKLARVFEECNLYGLFYMGDLSLIETKTLAVVGSRMPDSYGKKLTEDFCNVLSNAGLTIVSGLACGVDAIAHNCALTNGGKTIAVLGSGFDHIYPAMNTQLAHKVAQCGLIVTEYAPFVKPNGFQFPMRNRIIASISDSVLITQMGEKSGALHTKNYAIEFGKDLYICACDCYSQKGKGNLNVIEEFPNSATVSPRRILQDFGIDLKEQSKKSVQLSFEEQAIVDILKDGEKHYDEIVELTKFPPQRVNSLLTSLKISGIIRQSVGNYFSL